MAFSLPLAGISEMAPEDWTQGRIVAAALARNFWLLLQASHKAAYASTEMKRAAAAASHAAVWVGV